MNLIEDNFRALPKRAGLSFWVNPVCFVGCDPEFRTANDDEGVTNPKPFPAFAFLFPSFAFEAEVLFGVCCAVSVSVASLLISLRGDCLQFLASVCLGRFWCSFLHRP